MSPQKKQTTPQYGPGVSKLMNSHYYCLELVFIIKESEGYRLVVSHRDKLRWNNFYKTLRGAKIAFSHLFGRYRWSNSVDMEWSPFYRPELNWMNDLLNKRQLLEDKQVCHEYV